MQKSGEFLETIWRMLCIHKYFKPTILKIICLTRLKAKNNLNKLSFWVLQILFKMDSGVKISSTSSKKVRISKQTRNNRIDKFLK